MDRCEFGSELTLRRTDLTPSLVGDRPDTLARGRVRRARHGASRKRDALDWAAEAVNEHGRELAPSFVDAARRGDWRAADALMARGTS
jgi:hypothetical protein